MTSQTRYWHCPKCGGDSGYLPGFYKEECAACDRPAKQAPEHVIAWHRLGADGQPHCGPPCPCATEPYCECPKCAPPNATLVRVEGPCRRVNDKPTRHLWGHAFDPIGGYLCSCGVRMRAIGTLADGTFNYKYMPAGTENTGWDAWVADPGPCTRPVMSLTTALETVAVEPIESIVWCMSDVSLGPTAWEEARDLPFFRDYDLDGDGWPALFAWTANWVIVVVEEESEAFGSRPRPYRVPRHPVGPADYV